MTTQLAALAGVLRDVVGANLLAAYLHGSAVLGGLRPASDLDVLVVLGRSLDPAERAELFERILPLSGPGAGGRHLEVAAVVAGEVRPWRYPPVGDFLYGDWLIDEFHRLGPPTPGPEPDLAITLSQVLAGGRVLLGPDPATLLDPVPAGDLVRAGTDGLDGLLADLAGDTRNVLLTLARIWCTIATGRVVAKDAAAAWAGERVPDEHARVLAHARRLYLTATYAEETWPAAVRAAAPGCAAHLTDRIRAAGAAVGSG